MSFDNVKKKLGFGCMRLPVLENNEIDIEQLKAMVDLALENGINYFDTAYGYHSERSEGAVKTALVDRYPRESYFLADKLPLWLIESEEDVEKAFKLYQDYTDVVGYSKVVTLADLEKNGYTLAVNAYIEKPPAPPIDPVKVKQEYFVALDNVKECEERLYQLLKEGGYLE